MRHCPLPAAVPSGGSPTRTSPRGPRPSPGPGRPRRSSATPRNGTWATEGRSCQPRGRKFRTFVYPSSRRAARSALVSPVPRRPLPLPLGISYSSLKISAGARSTARVSDRAGSAAQVWLKCGTTTVHSFLTSSESQSMDRYQCESKMRINTSLNRYAQVCKLKNPCSRACAQELELLVALEGRS